MGWSYYWVTIILSFQIILQISFIAIIYIIKECAICTKNVSANLCLCFLALLFIKILFCFKVSSQRAFRNNGSDMSVTFIFCFWFLITTRSTYTNSICFCDLEKTHWHNDISLCNMLSSHNNNNTA